MVVQELGQPPMLISLLAVSPFSALLLTKVRGSKLGRDVATSFSTNKITKSECASPEPPPRTLLQEISDIYGYSESTETTGIRNIVTAGSQ